MFHGEEIGRFDSRWFLKITSGGQASHLSRNRSSKRLQTLPSSGLQREACIRQVKEGEETHVQTEIILFIKKGHQSKIKQNILEEKDVKILNTKVRKPTGYITEINRGGMNGGGRIEGDNSRAKLNRSPASLPWIGRYVCLHSPAR